MNLGILRKKPDRGMRLFLIFLLLSHPGIISIIRDQTTFIDASFSEPSPSGTIDSPNRIIQQTPEIPSVLKLGQIEDPTRTINLDPHTSWMREPLTLIFEPLVEYNEEEKEFDPVLAYQWTVTSDSKHWSFYLRDDILFHDGSQFDASVVKYSFERRASFPYFNLPFDSVEVVNNFLVTIHLSESYAPFLENFGQSLAMVSPNSYRGHPIGTGPYVYNTEESNSSFLQFDRFNEYHEGLAPFEEVQYKFYPFNNTEYEEDILAKKLDLIGGEPEDDPYWIESEISPFPWITFGAFNNNRSELANPNVRKAINYAIDNELIAAIIYPLAQPMHSLIPRGLLGHESTIEGYPYNLTKANMLLDQEGYIRDENYYRFNINLLTYPGFNDDVVGIINDSLDKIGIKCTITEDYRWTLVEKGEFDIALHAWPTTDPDFLRIWLASNGMGNYGDYSNKLMDSFIELGHQTPVQQEREYYYQQVQYIAQEDSPFLLLSQFLMRYCKSAPTSPYFHLNPNGEFKFNCSSPVYHPRFRITQVEIPTEESLYLPTTDTIVSNEHAESIILTMEMSRELEALTSNLQGSGKFYAIETTSQNVFYNFRCYYDGDEIGNFSVNELSLFQYDEDKSTWERLPTVVSNSSLRYIEVHLQGGVKLLRLGSIVKEITFFFIPFFSLIILGLIGVAVFTLVENTKLAKKLRTEMLQ